ncbi:aspartyl-phosphate phosphatase Spo0E family protein [Bacillus marasmi]|uniref:aspartyl-phosphate phosphatase Spo0E family protein n=1 Tax=Bacillus marasmi TaxID=1926279 RepID=UPI0011C76CE5|nr:aspartyl-phosphate phosphatase Spo0E family protein [Bacillus marasmi]
MYQEKESKSLMEEINELKTRLVDTVEKKGKTLTDEETVKRSQELDQLIFQYQKEAFTKLKRQEGSKAVLWSMMALIPNVLVEA